MKLLITGGCGFLGSNLASEALTRGYELILFDNLERQGSAHNLEWLSSQGSFHFKHGDIRNRNDVDTIIKETEPDLLFHLAGQVAMTTSIANPRKDLETNVLGTFNVLESIRNYSPSSQLIYSSTNKVYGDLEQFRYQETSTRYVCLEHPNGFSESVQLAFQSPYGCSKGAADQYVLDYSKLFGLNTVVFRHSSMYGGRQFSTYDQGWIGWFCEMAAKTVKDPKHEFTISGSGKQVRDVLHAEDMKALYFKTANNMELVSGRAFNVGGGIDNSLSLLELFEKLEEKTKAKLNFRRFDARESDQKVFVADLQSIQEAVGWSPVVTTDQGIELMLDWISKKL